MSNDLLLMSCKHCRGWMILAKYYQSEGLTSRRYFIDTTVFIDKHVGCWRAGLRDDGPNSLEGDTQFELHTKDAFMDGGALAGNRDSESQAWKPRDRVMGSDE